MVTETGNHSIYETFIEAPHYIYIVWKKLDCQICGLPIEQDWMKTEFHTDGKV